ncbi:MAG: hypothetical protein J6X91_00890 [Bacteroidales bacterium]|nr:hypothetical protein [Bacteroidales bacterium]
MKKVFAVLAVFLLVIVISSSFKLKVEELVRFCPRCANPYDYDDLEIETDSTHFYFVYTCKICGSEETVKADISADSNSVKTPVLNEDMAK